MLTLKRICNLLFLIRYQLRMVFRGHETHSGHGGCHKACFQRATAAVGDDDWQSLQKQTSVGVNVRSEGWLGSRPKPGARKMLISVHYFPAQSQKCLPSPPPAKLPSSGEWLNRICCRGDDGVHRLHRWSESAGIGPRGGSGFQLPSITDKPIGGTETKRLISATGPKQGSSDTFIFNEPQWIHYFFGTMSWWIKSLSPQTR